MIKANSQISVHLQHVIVRAKETLIYVGRPDLVQGAKADWTPGFEAETFLNSLDPSRRRVFETSNGFDSRTLLTKMQQKGFRVQERDLVLAQGPKEAIATAARLMHVSVSRCLVIDESAAGIEAAQELGAGVVVGTKTSNTPDARLLAAHYVVEDLSKIKREGASFTLTDYIEGVAFDLGQNSGLDNQLG